MAHGFGGELTWRLPSFAERFAEQGLATFCFDYRSFSDSDGEPQQLIDPFKQRADWLAAIDHVRSVSTDDSDRLGLWGTSFSGGHAIETVSRVDDVSAVVAQVPFVDGPRTALKLIRTGGVEYLNNDVPAVIRNLDRVITYRDPYYVLVAGSPDEFALLNTPDAVPEMEALIPDDQEWDNRCPARMIPLITLYRPLSRADAVGAPALIALTRRFLLLGEQVFCDLFHHEAFEESVLVEPKCAAELPDSIRMLPVFRDERLDVPRSVFAFLLVRRGQRDLKEYGRHPRQDASIVGDEVTNLVLVFADVDRRPRRRHRTLSG